jgi:excisionase family DNA binding protein
MKPWFKKAKRDEQEIARSSIGALSQSLQFVEQNGNDHVHLVVPGVKGVVEIPTRSFLLLNELMAHLAAGRSVALFHSDMELTTQEAADLLNVSRPHLVKLLESGMIPFKKMNTHRRIAANDILAYARKHQLDISLSLD